MTILYYTWVTLFRIFTGCILRKGLSCWSFMSILFLLIVSTSSLSQTQAQSPESVNSRHFRVDSVVRLEKTDSITEIKTSTVFSEGAVFDFIGDNGEIIIYRKEKGLFILIDPIHRVQSELSLEDIEVFLVNIRSRLLQNKDKFNRFMAEPLFDITKNETGDELIFQSRWIEYKVQLRSFEEAGLDNEYYLFSDVYSKLNIYLNPGVTTPFARIQINEELRRTGQFPHYIEIALYPKGKWLFGKVIKIESRHTLVRRLSEQDKGRITRALHFEVQFPKIPFGRYQKMTREM